MRQSLLSGSALGSVYRLVLPREALRGRDGSRAGTAAGSSLDFLDFREYHPGDDLRRLDWSVLARTDREVVKLYREEVLPRLDLVLDTSASMATGDPAPASGAAAPKPASLLFLAAALATAASASGISTTLWHLAPPSGFSRVEGSSSLAPALWPLPEFSPSAPASAGRSFAPRSIRILLSDLLWPGDPLATLRPLSDGAAAVFVAQLLTREEESPSDRGPCRLVDSETGLSSELVLDEDTVAAYRSALAAHRARWADACRSSAAVFSRLSSEEVLSNDLSPLLRCGLLASL